MSSIFGARITQFDIIVWTCDTIFWKEWQEEIFSAATSCDWIKLIFEGLLEMCLIFLSILVHKILHNNNTTSFLPFYCKPRKQPWPNPSMTVLYWRKSRLKRWKGRGSKKRNLKNIEEKLGIEHNYLSYLKD